MEKQLLKLKAYPKSMIKVKARLLDVALDPEFAANRMIYFTYSEPVKGGNPTSIAKAKLSNEKKGIKCNGKIK